MKLLPILAILALTACQSTGSQPRPAPMYKAGASEADFTNDMRLCEYELAKLNGGYQPPLSMTAACLINEKGWRWK